MKKLIYLDNAATSPVCEAAKAATNEAMELFANPSSAHAAGTDARRRVEEARKMIASAAGAPSDGVIFTSGGTEADALALLGGVSRRGRTVIISDSEHPAVEMNAKELERRGWKVFCIPTRGGRLDLDALRAEAEKGDTALMSVMHVNNETGAIYDVAEAARIVRTYNPDCFIHSDCVQSFCRERFTLLSLGVDAVSVSAHKIGGVKGAGALICRAGLHLKPVVFGGGQEKGLRSGTENTVGIAAFAAAVSWALPNLDAERERVFSLREQMKALLAPHGVIFNEPERFSPHVLSVSIPGLKSEVALRMLSDRGVMLSAGSACSSKLGVSPVLKAFGLPRAVADGTLRISFGALNTPEEIGAAAAGIAAVAALASPRGSAS
ncbi:MAG: cysteine desulfurase [Clostridia bacterium]|nr:cysteine desulfurase [Clostridia bacterium]